MRKIEIQELSLESFSKYGQFSNMINPDAVKIGQEPIEFYRDMVGLDLGRITNPHFSVCRVSKRPGIINVTEIHSTCGEGDIPLDGDIVIHVGIATPNGEVPLDKFEAFRVPKGTFFALDPGVWHHAPFAYKSDVVNVLVVVPRRIYASDCIVVEISEKDQIEIAGL